MKSITTENTLEDLKKWAYAMYSHLAFDLNSIFTTSQEQDIIEMIEDYCTIDEIQTIISKWFDEY